MTLFLLAETDPPNIRDGIDTGFFSVLLGPILMAVVLFLVVWVVVDARRRKAFLEMVTGKTQKSSPAPEVDDSAPIAPDNTDVRDLKAHMRHAVSTLRRSRLGDRTGRNALYALPCHMLIGPSGAGKTQVVLNAGLHFPLGVEAGRASKGTGGTRDCDWFFTKHGVFLDTTGRYAGDASGHAAWLTFLDLLRRYRRRRPIDGLIVTIAIDQLFAPGDDASEVAANLATTLRKRLHEITERLQVMAPVYVLFSKADQIPGFSAFFASLPASERHQPWGGTMDYDPNHPADARAQFVDHFSELTAIIRDKENQRIRHGDVPEVGGLYTLSREMQRCQDVLASFIEVLFGEDHFHGRPVMRGFYLTSALPGKSPSSPVQAALHEKLGIAGEPAPVPTPPDSYVADGPFFLRDVFHDIVLKDTDLVQPYMTQRTRRRRVAAYVAMSIVAGLSFAWIYRSYHLAMALRAHVQADFDAIDQRVTQHNDLESRLDALLILQDRLEQLIAFRDHEPSELVPVYSDGVLLPQVREAYFDGIRHMLVQPAAAEFERYLTSVGAPGETYTPQANTEFAMPDPKDRQAAYAALKAYLMLASPGHVESTHLSTELARFWRVWLEQNRGTMSREAMIGKADRLVRFYTSIAAEDGWSRMQPTLTVVDGARRSLAEALRGTPARDRVYADIVARASARYPGIPVQGIAGDGSTVLTGSYAVPGAYTQAAWEGYVKGALGDASTKALDTSDWVLESRQVDDLTLSGSPEHVRKDLEAEYAKRYIAEWQAFLAGVSVAPFSDFAGAAAGLEQLADKERSPLKAVLSRARKETAWDDLLPLPKDSVTSAAATRGPVSQTFGGLARLVDARDGANAPIDCYLESLGQVRTRLRTIGNEGDLGPGARRFLEATLQGKDSELVDALRGADEQMLTGMNDAQRAALRPVLVRPLVQTFAALVAPVEAELNQVWDAQVAGPFRDELARKLPFDEAGRIEAGSDEIGRIFGPAGAIARYASDTLGPLVERRGDILTPRRWGDHGLTLSPQLLSDFPLWVSADGTGTAGQHTVFQLMPEPTMAGISEYTVTIAGQSLRYRNEVPQWSNFVWGGSNSNGASIDATSTDGRSIRVADFPGAGALGQLVDAANRVRNEDGTHTLAWETGGAKVAMRLRIMTSSRVDADGVQKRGLRGVQLPSTIAGTETPPGVAR